MGRQLEESENPRSAMVTTRPAPSWVLLDSEVHLHKEDERTEPDWAIIQCSETRAYVTLDNGDDRPDGMSPFRLSPFDGLNLLVRVADPPYTSALSIRLDGDPHKDERRGSLGNVLLADGGFVILSSSCLPDVRGSNSYIVFDAANASLAMISSKRFRPSITYVPLPLRRTDGGYVLALITMDMNKEVVCLMPSPLHFDHHWQVKTPLFPPEKPILFRADNQFSFQGRAFWVDLGEGILCCDNQDLLSSSSDNVQFSYIELPLGCKVAFDPSFRDIDPSRYRAICCIGDSLRFVSIEGYHTVRRRDMVLCMWTLMPSSSGEWCKVGEICVGRLWEQEGFKNAGLPAQGRPTRPMLSSHEDGIVYFFLLGDFHQDEDDDRDVYMFSVNMFTGRFVSSWRLPSSCCPHSNPQFLMGSDIFKHIEGHHLHPIVVPCDVQDKVFPVPPTTKRDRDELAKVFKKPKRMRMQRHHREAVLGLTSKGDLERESTSGVV